MPRLRSAGSLRLHAAAKFFVEPFNRVRGAQRPLLRFREAEEREQLVAAFAQARDHAGAAFGPRALEGRVGPAGRVSIGARRPRATRSSRQPFHAANDSPPHSSRASRCLCQDADHARYRNAHYSSGAPHTKGKAIEVDVDHVEVGERTRTPRLQVVHSCLVCSLDHQRKPTDQRRRPIARGILKESSASAGRHGLIDAVARPGLSSRCLKPGAVRGGSSMKCPRCEQENPPQAKFCLECASPLALRCPNCGTHLPAGAKFCFECATPVSTPGSPSRFASPESYTPKHLAERILTSRSAVEGERKLVPNVRRHLPRRWRTTTK